MNEVGSAVTSVRDLVHRSGELSFTVSGPAGEERVRFWGDVPESRGPAVDPALAASLLVAMASGGELALPGPLSPQLRRALPDIQAVLQTLTLECTLIDRTLERVEVTTHATGREGDPGIGSQEERGVAAFFSGGVDSWSTLLSNPEITDLIYVHGFDIPIDKPTASATVERHIAQVAEKLGRRLHIVRTNMRAVVDPNVSWEIGHGPGLAAVALLFVPLCERVMIGSTATYGRLIARSSHPLHDHLWSTEQCRIEHFGAHLTRAEKVAQVATRQEALDVLRVCWADVDSYNCGRCEKCIRTMTALEAAGALDRCPAFATPLDLEAVANLRLDDSDLLAWWRENLEFARERRASGDLIDAIDACIASNERRQSRDREGGLREEQVQEARAQAEALERELETLVSSTSWRLTDPLRRAGAAARRFKRLRGARP